MAFTLSPEPFLQFTDALTGALASNGTLQAYAAGSTTPIAVYKDSTGTPWGPGTGTVPLDSLGRATIYLIEGTAYKYVISDSLGNVIRTQDNIVGTVSTVSAGVATVALGGTGVSTLGANGVLVGAGTSQVVVTAAGITGQVLAGNTGNPPTFQASTSLGVWRLLTQNSGTDSSAGATNVDTLAISGLTVKDLLKVVICCESVTQATAGLQLYSVTDAIQIGYAQANGVIAATVGGLETATLGMRQGSTTAMVTYNEGGTFANGNLFIAGPFALTTAWTGAWTLALRHLGVTAAGTFKWQWWVYKVVGQ